MPTNKMFITEVLMILQTVEYIPQDFDPVSDGAIKSPTGEDDSTVDYSDNSGARDIPQTSEPASDETTETPVADNNDNTVDDPDSSAARHVPQNSEPVSDETTESTATDDDDSHVDYAESSGSRDLPQNTEVTSSQRTNTRPSNNSSLVRETEVIEQFEPGVYVTIVQLRNDVKFFRRVRFRCTDKLHNSVYGFSV